MTTMTRPRNTSSDSSRAPSLAPEITGAPALSLSLVVSTVAIKLFGLLSLLLGLLTFLDHLGLGFARHFLVVAELLAVNAAAADQRAQRAGVAVKFFRGHVGLDELEAPFHVHALDLAAAARQI